MSVKIDELKQRAAGLLREARAIQEASSTPELSAEDQEKYDRTWKAYADAKAAVKRETDLQAEERFAAEPDHEGTKPDVSDDGKRTPPTATPEYRAAFKQYIQTGTQSRALQADSGPAGGYIVTPEQFVNELLKAADNAVFIRQKATVVGVPNADSLGVPSLEADPDDFDWTVELGTGSEDSTMAFGKRELHPHPVAKRLKVSQKLIRASTIDAEALVRDRLAYKLGVTMEKAYLTGTGSGQPLGIFVTSTDGITTARNTTAASTTAFTADELTDVKFSLKPQYRRVASWLMHRDVVKYVSKFKDGNGQYLLQPGLSADIPDRILGLPFMESEYAPATFTAALYLVALGDFSFYWIADALNLSIQRLVELYAEANQVGFIARYEGDGMPVMAEAFARLILHA